MKILLVGGYGTFGGRIVELLEDEPRLTLVLAGRSLAKAEAYCRSRAGAQAKLVPAMFDREGNLDRQIGELAPDLVVDASGPFQAYGGGRYRLIEACIGRGLNYMDLADGAAFVAGVDVFDAAARAKGVYVLAGVSSFPVLTAAVVRKLAVGMTTVEAIRGGIAPSPYAGVGENVIRAIASYAGQAIEVRRDNGKAVAYPFTEQVRYTIAPPGRVPLRSTLFSLVDVPDLRALASLWPEARSIWMGAGPVPEILHRALIGLAWLTRLRLLPTLSPLARLMHWATNRLRWGEHRGGMFVEVTGAGADGSRLQRSWHLLAEGKDGPLIPSMAVAAIVRKALDGAPPVAGARAALTELEVEDYESSFRGRTIHHGARDDTALADRPLYERILGNAWATLPAEIRAMHDVREGEAVAEGRASVERGRNPLARLAGWLVGFPKAAGDTGVRVRFCVRDGVETWTRTFGGESFDSRQFAGRGRASRLVCEQFGPLVFAFAVTTGGGRLSLVLRRWSAFGVPLPMWLCPRSDSFEERRDDRFHFNVEISHPWVGLIARYRGWLTPVDAANSAVFRTDPGKLATLSTE